MVVRRALLALGLALGAVALSAVAAGAQSDPSGEAATSGGPVLVVGVVLVTIGAVAFGARRRRRER
ncbi:MAG: hypothetical protein KDB04_00250 [Acidimicrobiales bacterium]|nr:hypothetical protein [Acidimicrobiales bacterium]HRW36594.1 hypothetical protein [Aquihabitans sp.]